LLVAALRFNPTLAESRAHVKEATSAVITAKALPNLTVGLASEYDLTRVAESPWLWSISTDFLLDAVFKEKLRTALAQTLVRAARLDYAESIWIVRKELRASLLAVVLAERREALLADTERDREQLAQSVRQRRALGEASATEQLQVEVESNRAQIAHVNAQQELLAARARLAAVIGVPIAALDSLRLQWSDLESPVLPDEVRLDELRQQALLSRADLERAIVDYQAREVELQQQVRAQYPQLSLGPGYMWDHGIQKATLGISLSLPIFNRNRGPIAEAAARREAAGEHLLSVQATVINDIDAAQRAYRNALNSLSAANRESESTRSLLRSTDQAVRLGSEDQATLLAARLAVASDELATIDAIERTQLALGHWEDALRTPLTGSEINLQSAADASH
jgi:outer membrane protein TolC